MSETCTAFAAPGCQCRECLQKENAIQQYFNVKLKSDNVKLKSELKVCQERVEELLGQLTRETRWTHKNAGER